MRALFEDNVQCSTWWVPPISGGGRFISKAQPHALQPRLNFQPECDLRIDCDTSEYLTVLVSYRLYEQKPNYICTNKLAQLRRHASRVHFAKMHFG